MKEKIKITRLIDLKSSNVATEDQEFYDTLLEGLKNEVSIGNLPQGSNWSQHRKKKSMLYNNLCSYAEKYARGLYNTNRGLKGNISARGNAEIPMEFKGIDIIDYDWDNTVHFRLLFESKEYLLVNNFGTLLLLSPMTDGINTFILDIGLNSDLSISSSVITKLN